MTLINVHPGKYTTIVPGDFDNIDLRAGNTAALANGWVATGSGEPPTVGIGAAVANAFFDATGVRIRQAPMNPATRERSSRWLRWSAPLRNRGEDPAASSLRDGTRSGMRLDPAWQQI